VTLAKKEKGQRKGRGGILKRIARDGHAQQLLREMRWRPDHEGHLAMRKGLSWELDEGSADKGASGRGVVRPNKSRKKVACQAPEAHPCLDAARQLLDQKGKLVTPNGWKSTGERKDSRHLWIFKLLRSIVHNAQRKPRKNLGSMEQKEQQS